MPLDQQHRRNPRDDAHIKRLTALRPELGTFLGLPEGTSDLPAHGQEERRSVLEANVAWRRDLEAQTKESAERLLDTRVFSASLELARYAEEELNSWASDPDVASGLAEILLRHLKGLMPLDPAERFSTLARRLRGVPAYLQGARPQLKRPSAELLGHTREILEGFPELLRAIADGARRAASAERPIEPALVAEVESAVDVASGAVEDHGAWLGAQPGVVHAPLGRSRFDELLRLRGLDLTSNEVLELGRAVAEEMWIEQARVLRRGFKGEPLGAALAMARRTSPLSLAEAVAWMRELVEQSRTFLADNGAVPVPSGSAANADERVDVDAMPACLAWPSGVTAGYVPPQAYAVRQDGLLLLRETPGPQADALADLAVAELENDVALLAFPGRHLQSVWWNRTTSLARRGAMLGALGGPGGIWAQDMQEGWALTAAELMREQHFRHSPAARLMMVRRMLRAALFAIADVALSTGRLSADAATGFLARRAGLRPAVARAVVRNMLRLPTSGVSGLVGKVRIEQLRREACGRWRGGFNARRFHSFLLVNGPVPLAYLFERLDEPPAFITDVVTASHPIPDENA